MQKYQVKLLIWWNWLEVRHLFHCGSPRNRNVFKIVNNRIQPICRSFYWFFRESLRTKTITLFLLLKENLTKKSRAVRIWLRRNNYVSNDDIITLDSVYFRSNPEFNFQSEKEYYINRYFEYFHDLGSLFSSDYLRVLANNLINNFSQMFYCLETLLQISQVHTTAKTLFVKY